MRKILIAIILSVSAISAFSQANIVLNTKEMTLDFIQYYNSTLSEIDRLLLLLEANSREYNVTRDNEPQLSKVKTNILSLAKEIDTWIFSKKFSNIAYLKYQPTTKVRILIGKNSELDDTNAFLNADNVLNTSISDFIKIKANSITDSNAYMIVPEIQRAVAYYRFNISHALEVSYKHQSFLVGSLNTIFKWKFT